MMNCPKCRKPMAEEKEFPGYWRCPDYKTPIKDAPPFEFKCKGSVLTRAGARALRTELNRVSLEKLSKQN